MMSCSLLQRIQMNNKSVTSITIIPEKEKTRKKRSLDSEEDKDSSSSSSTSKLLPKGKKNEPKHQKTVLYTIRNKKKYIILSKILFCFTKYRVLDNIRL